MIEMNKNSDFFNEDLSLEEINLYNRQFRLDGWNQAILKKSRVLIVGVGGLGCEIAKNLAMVGVGHLDLVDMDTIEHSNLNRQILFVDAKEGDSKAKIAAKKLRKINPNIEVNGYFMSLERLKPEIYKKADVIVGGLDSMNARINLNAHAIRFGKPLVDGGVVGYHGHIYTTFPGKNACVECYPVTTENEDMAACTVVGKPRKRIHCVFKSVQKFIVSSKGAQKDPDPKNLDHINIIQKTANHLAKKFNFLPEFSQKEIIKIIDVHDPGVITINAVISAIQSHETVKILNWIHGNKGLGAPSERYIIYNGMTLKFYSIEKKRNKNCTQCGEKVRRENIKIKKNDFCGKIIDKLIQKGYIVEINTEPLLTLMDYNGITVIDLDQKVSKNNLRNLEMITAVGFKEGEIFVTLQIY